MTTLPAPDRPPDPERSSHPRQRATHDDMVMAAARRHTVTGRLVDGRQVTGTLVRWPHPDRSHRRSGAGAVIRTDAGRYLSIVADPERTTVHDQEGLAS